MFLNVTFNVKVGVPGAPLPRRWSWTSTFSVNLSEDAEATQMHVMHMNLVLSTEPDLVCFDRCLCFKRT